MIDIEWRGTFDVSGYGIWCRKLCKILIESGEYNVKVISVRKRLEPEDYFYEYQDIQLDDPIRVENLIPIFPPINEEKTGFCTCTELKTPPYDQIQNLEMADFVIGLSSFSTRAYKSVVSNKKKVFKVNFPFFKDEFSPKGKSFKFENIKDETFKFLTIGRIDVRKNLECLIKNFTEEFGDERNVALIVKTYSPDTCLPLWFNSLNPSKNIYLLDEKLPNMSYLYRSVDAYITTDLGEAWSGPCTEAMLSGIPTIAPRHSGHLDYMNDDNSWLIDVSGWRKIGYREDNKYRNLLPDYGEVKYPIDNSVKEKMREVYNEFKSIPKKERTEHEKIKNALKVFDLVKPEVILSQLNKCFKWVNNN